MSVEGLRAWIGEVERKLGKRTRVFLALAVIAIGLGGAAIYLAIDAREGAVSESDVQELQRELEAQIDAAGAAAPPVAAPVEPVEPAPEAAPDQTQPEPGGNGEGSSGGAGSGGVSPDGLGAAAPGQTSDRARLRELLEQTKEQNAEAEAEQAGK